MQTYLELAEFCKLVHLNEDAVKGMMANGALNFKEEDGKIYIEANQGTFSIVPSGTNEATPISSISLAGESFVEKTIGTILNLHEKVLDAKDETLDTLKNENKFLKDALYSMQDIYDEDRKTIDILNAQLASAREEVEFLKRKYKLMWNKAVDNFTQSKEKSSFGDVKDLGENEAKNAPSNLANEKQNASNLANEGQNLASNEANSALNGVNSLSSEANLASSNTQSPQTSAINAAKAAQSVFVPNSSTNSGVSVNSNLNSATNSNTNATLNSTTSANSTLNSATNSSLNSASNANLGANSSLNSTQSPNSTPNSSQNSSQTPTNLSKNEGQK